jgi:hypothetical protein
MDIGLLKKKDTRKFAAPRGINSESVTLERMDASRFLDIMQGPGTTIRKCVEVAVICVVDWEGYEENGQPAECTKENVRKVASNSYAFAVKIQNFMDDWIDEFIRSTGEAEKN